MHIVTVMTFETENDMILMIYYDTYLLETCNKKFDESKIKYSKFISLNIYALMGNLSGGTISTGSKSRHFRKNRQIIP